MLLVASTPTSEMQGLLWNSDETKMNFLPCIAAKHTVEPCGQPRPVDESGGSRAAIDVVEVQTLRRRAAAPSLEVVEMLKPRNGVAGLCSVSWEHEGRAKRRCFGRSDNARDA